MLILITEDRGQTFRQVDEADLVKRIDVFDTDEYRFEATEYCLRGCAGNAHVADKAQGDGSFCEFHVHRSIDGQIKRWPAEAGAVSAGLV